MPTLSIFKSGSGRHQGLASLKSGTGCPSIPGVPLPGLYSHAEREGEKQTLMEKRGEDREKRKRGAGGDREMREGRGGRGGREWGGRAAGKRHTEGPRSTGRDKRRTE